MRDDKAVYILNRSVFTAQYDVPKGTRCAIWKDDGSEYVDLLCAVGGIVKGVSRYKIATVEAWRRQQRRSMQAWSPA